MSLEQKVAQMFVVRPEAADSVDRAVFPLGGYCVFAHNFTDPRSLDSLLCVLGNQPIKPMFCIDEEGGRVARIGANLSFDVPRYPPMKELGKRGEDAVYSAGRSIGSYLKRYGFAVDFAPVADVDTNPDNPVIGKRAFSEDPQRAATLMCAFMRGLGDEGVMGCLKHFPGHGDTSSDSHMDYVESLKTWEQMLACEMVTFRAGIEAGAQMVMVGHIATPAVEGCGALPATLSPVMIQDKLRGELGFKGVVITDSMAMGAISKHYGSAGAAVLAIKAGVDIVLMPSNIRDAVGGVIDAVRTGEIPESRIDESVRRIFALKLSRSRREGYSLKEVIEVDGRQGVACDGEYYYVSGSTALYKYRMDGTLVCSNEKPFEGLELAANHIGDIDVFEGEIYAGIECFMDGVGTNIQAAVYSCDNLEWKRSINWAPESGQVEVCGLGVDRENRKLYMADWVNGSHIYRYDLDSGQYEGRVRLNPEPHLQQGIFIKDGFAYLSADDGDAEKDEPDRIYRANVSPDKDGRYPQSSSVEVFRVMNDFRRCGEIEGLCFNPLNGDLVVLSNRGARIILGMPRGFYPGYEREIHEIYIYETNPCLP